EREEQIRIDAAHLVADQATMPRPNFSATVKASPDIGDLISTRRRDALQYADLQLKDRLEQALAAMPGAGSTFLDFQLIGELGGGALSRVYLAQQGNLANRHVVLKFAVDLNGESQTLAQLQHTNIVPIYSVHATPLF